MKPGKRHRLRLINPSVDNHFTVSLVGHDMTVIATDFVPVNAWTTSNLFMAPGQRYDVTIDASATPGNYWFNATFSGRQACGESSIVDTHPPAAIFQYENAEEGIPTDVGTAPPDSDCEDSASFVPVLEREIPPETFGVDEDNTLDVVLATRPWEDVENRVYWDVHGHDMNITWSEPTLKYIAEGDLDFPARYNVLTFEGEVSGLPVGIKGGRELTVVVELLACREHERVAAPDAPPRESPTFFLSNTRNLGAGDGKLTPDRAMTSS